MCTRCRESGGIKKMFSSIIVICVRLSSVSYTHLDVYKRQSWKFQYSIKFSAVKKDDEQSKQLKFKVLYALNIFGNLLLKMF